MTLATRIAFRTPVDPEAVYAVVDPMVNDRGVPSIVKRSPGRISNLTGQGNRSMLDVKFSSDGGVLDDTAEYLAECARYEDEVRPLMHRFCVPGPYYLKVRLDTAYGYREEGIGGCSDLHGGIVKALIASFPEADIVWHNEYAGEWHEGLEGLDKFMGEDAFAMESWFECFVKSAVETGVGPVVWEG